uniref:Uncharacterized protein n=1 Tax=Brassica oleracea var. oleracea TaxID=109376 RepID=A0A0D3A3W9_BRAOL
MSTAWSDFPERLHEVVVHHIPERLSQSDRTKSLAFSRPEVLKCRSRSRCSERPVGATHQGRSRPLVRRHQNRESWSDLLERPTKVAPSQSDQLKSLAF